MTSMNLFSSPADRQLTTSQPDQQQNAFSLPAASSPMPQVTDSTPWSLQKPSYSLLADGCFTGARLSSTMRTMNTAVTSECIDASTKTGVPLKQMAYLSPMQYTAISGGYVTSIRSFSDVLKQTAALQQTRGTVENGVRNKTSGSSMSPRPFATNSRYKTELCRPFEEYGHCKYGDKCQFAHGPRELRKVPRHPKYKTELCRTFHATGFCPYGPRCHFIHSDGSVARSRKSPVRMTTVLMPTNAIFGFCAAVCSDEDEHFAQPTFIPSDRMRLNSLLMTSRSVRGFIAGSTGENSTSGTWSGCDTPSSVSPNSMHDDSPTSAAAPFARKQPSSRQPSCNGACFNFPLSRDDHATIPTRSDPPRDPDDDPCLLLSTFLSSNCLDDNDPLSHDLSQWIADLELNGSVSDSSNLGKKSGMDEIPTVSFGAPLGYAKSRLPIFNQISSVNKCSAA